MQKDSTFAPAYTGLAGAHLMVGADDSLQVIKLLPEAVEAAEKALVLSGNSPEAQAVVAEVKHRLAEAGQRALEFDVRLDSLDAKGDTVRVMVEAPTVVNEEWLAQMTEFGEQMRRLYVTRHAEGAGALPPQHPVQLARQLESLGEYDQAERVLRRSVERDPSNQQAWDELERLHAVRGHYSESVDVRMERVARSGASPQEIAAATELQKAVAARGAVGYWEQRRKEFATKEEEGEPFSQVDYATTLLALRDYEAALDRLEVAYEARDRKIGSLFNDPIWDPIRGEPRFRSLLTKIRQTPWPPPPPPAAR